MHFSHTLSLSPLDHAVEYSLDVPEGARAVAQLLNGTGQSAYGDYERFIADCLAGHGIGSSVHSLRPSTLPGSVRANGMYEPPSFEILGQIACGMRLVLQGNSRLSQLKLCILACGDGAGAALYAAATAPAGITAMVISGGRPGPALALASRNTVPTLFIIGSDDHIATDSVRAAFAGARGPKELSVIPRTGHLLREPGTLEEIALQSARWFQRYVDHP